MLVKMFIPGIPAPGGSKKAFVINGRARIVDDAKNNRGWKQDVKAFAAQAMQGRAPIADPLYVRMCFYFPRPKWHFGSGRNAGVLKPNAPKHITKKPDVLKLARSTEDAMTGVVYLDDAQTVTLLLEKFWADDGQPPGCLVVVTSLATVTELREPA